MTMSPSLSLKPSLSSPNPSLPLPIIAQSHAMPKTSKTPQKQGSHLRVLAIAYATGRISRDIYLKERTRQLGAMEFGKPLPGLPEDLLDIVIPTVKIDASYVNATKQGRGRGKIILFIVVLLLVFIGAGAGAWYSGLLFQKEKPKAQVSQPKLADYAGRLLRNPQWSERDLKTFLRLWASHSATAREKARRQTWYLKLDNEIIKRINQAELRKNNTSEEELPRLMRQLNLLRAFQAKLSSN